MKKILITLSAFVLCIGANAFTIRNHATVAYIAEQHMTSKAKARVSEILHGEHLYEYASWPDFYRLTMLDESGKQIGHGMKVNEDFCPVYNGAYAAIKGAVARLADYREMSDSARIADMSIIIHLMGDIHCPSHISYADKRHKKIKNLYYRMNRTGHPKKINYHAFWDDWATNTVYCGGYLDLAQIVDICSKKEIKEIQKGTLEDWCQDSALCCKDIFDVPDGADIDRMYVVGKVQLAKSQIRKAGYRLAKIMNDIYGR